jgi:hypothetical protein
VLFDRCLFFLSCAFILMPWLVTSFCFKENLPFACLATREEFLNGSLGPPRVPCATKNDQSYSTTVMSHVKYEALSSCAQDGNKSCKYLLLIYH